MYAIRSYYGFPGNRLFRINEGSRLKRIDGFSHVSLSYVNQSFRITSYNVCYTKLLRILGKEGIFVSLRTDSDCGNPELSAGTHDPDCYFTAVCNEYFFEHNTFHLAQFTQLTG